MSCLWNSDTQTGVPSFFLIQITHHSSRSIQKSISKSIAQQSISIQFAHLQQQQHHHQTHNRNGLRRIPASKQAGRQAASKQMYTQTKKSENTLQSGNNGSFKSKTKYSYYELHFQFEQFICTQRLLRQVQTRTNAMHTQPRQSLANRDVRDCVFLLNSGVIMTKTQAPNPVSESLRHAKSH